VLGAVGIAFSAATGIVCVVWLSPRALFPAALAGLLALLSLQRAETFAARILAFLAPLATIPAIGLAGIMVLVLFDW
jgi:hypothetical protein